MAVKTYKRWGKKKRKFPFLWTKGRNWSVRAVWVVSTSLRKRQEKRKRAIVGITKIGLPNDRLHLVNPLAFPSLFYRRRNSSRPESRLFALDPVERNERWKEEGNAEKFRRKCLVYIKEAHFKMNWNRMDLTDWPVGFLEERLISPIGKPSKLFSSRQTASGMISS